MAARRTSVLLVEDEALISDLIAEVLSEGGFSVHAVAAGEDALLYLESGADVDVLFTDINLLGPMDGATLAREARATARIAGGLLFRTLLAVRAAAAGAAFGLRQEALQSDRFVPPAGAVDGERAPLRSPSGWKTKSSARGE